jgi:RNA-directed DNA polymerase
MDDRRQKNQLVLAFMEEYRGEAPKGLQEGTESSEGKRGTESPAIAEQLMEEVCERENCKQALKRVKANKGSGGVDGMTVQQLPEYLKQYWPAIRKQLLSGTYKPQPVRRVEILKPDGGVRKLGIPTVLDRFIQQAVMQVLQGRWDRTFSDHSYGFRPGRSAHQAVAKAQQVYRRRVSLVCGLGPREILRPGLARQTDGENRNQGRRPAVAETDPFVSEGRSDGRRAGESGG